MRIGIAQIAPVFLDRDATIDKVVARLDEAGREGCSLVAFGETIIPGYPAWLHRTDGAKFDDPIQKELHALYLDQAVVPEQGHLKPVCDAAREAKSMVVLGIAERAEDRGGHSVYCSRVIISPTGDILSTHRKLMPTYEERMSWGIGDGSGLVTHTHGDFTVGALNCWENWMPLARAALYAEGEDLHVMLWPGSSHNTSDLTRFVARESRSYVISACGLLCEQDCPASMPHRDRFLPSTGETILNGGSALAGPDGEWIIEPVTDRETLLVADLDHARVREERQNFDAPGHYARPDVLRLIVDRRRQVSVEWVDHPDDIRPVSPH